MTVRVSLSSISRALALAALIPGCTSHPAAPAPDATSTSDPPDTATGTGSGSGSACRDYSTQKNAYFGDLHTHTSFSADAYSFDTRTMPIDAWAFARGKEMVTVASAVPGGPTTQLDRALDFAAITDHSEFLAEDFGCGSDLSGQPFDPQSTITGKPLCKAIRSTDPKVQDANFAGLFAYENALCNSGSGVSPGESATCKPIVTSAWSEEVADAEAANDPCRFTSFLAYEWTSDCTGDGGAAATCHKNVIFGDSNVPPEPFDSITDPSQESLWSALDTGCNGGPCNALTIPHNSNLSKGQAFTIPQGSEAHAIQYQKLVEIIQHKGGSECFFDPNNTSGGDATCDFNYLGGSGDLRASYVRTGLETGLTDQAATHADPLQLGIVGATDDHNGAPGNTREDTWPGHLGRTDDTPDLRIQPSNANAIGFNPGGVAVAWAEQNTREAIFAAFQRRETYATSGPRITVRMYQTWDQTTDFCTDSSFPTQILAAGGQPMGSNIAIPPGTTAKAPRIVVYAARDPDRKRPDIANLGEVDLVEAWVDATGAVQENVVRRMMPSGGSTTTCQTFRLDVPTQPAAFTAGAPSFYYARVLQVPTNRWSVYDCAASPASNPAACAAGGTLNTTQTERAWTSPIWYLP